MEGENRKKCDYIALLVFIFAFFILFLVSQLEILPISKLFSLTYRKAKAQGSRYSMSEVKCNMEQSKKKEDGPKIGLLRTEELYEYILETSVYPREPEPLKELRHVAAIDSGYTMATALDAGQLMAMFLRLVNATKTIEIGVYTGYSLLLTALAIPDHGEIVAIDINRKVYEIGLPVIKKYGVDHKINFIEYPALPILDVLLQDPKNVGAFDYAYVDADKENYLNYHEKLLKLIRIGGVIAYDNTLWDGFVAMPEESVPHNFKDIRKAIIELNKSLAADPRIQIAHVSIGDGATYCMRLK